MSPSETPKTPHPNDTAIEVGRTAIKAIGSSPAAKLFVIALLSLLLTIPALLQWVLVEERQSRSNSVVRDIAASWGKSQTINGPYLVLPYVVGVETASSNNSASKVTQVRKNLIILPEELNISSDVAVETRSRGIYDVPVYQATSSLNGQFAAAKMSELRKTATSILFDEAFIAIGISDNKGIKNQIVMETSDGSRPFEPSLNGLGDGQSNRRNVIAGSPNGVHLKITQNELKSGFNFKINLQLNGSTSLFFAPTGKTTNMKAQSNWADPSFTGAFLPDNREIRKEGFSAEWRIPYLARGIAQQITRSDLPLHDSLIGVRFVQDLSPYQSVSRTFKYALALIALTFTVIFLLELKFGQLVHWIQYSLVGFALVIFYILLLGFSEHVGFDRAFGIAALAVTGLVSIYLALITHSKEVGISMAAGLGSLYTLLYLLLSAGDYALLTGAIFAFTSLAVVMFVTKDLDWSRARATAVANANSK